MSADSHTPDTMCPSTPKSQAPVAQRYKLSPPKRVLPRPWEEEPLGHRPAPITEALRLLTSGANLSVLADRGRPFKGHADNAQIRLRSTRCLAEPARFPPHAEAE